MLINCRLASCEPQRSLRLCVIFLFCFSQCPLSPLWLIPLCARSSAALHKLPAQPSTFLAPRLSPHPNSSTHTSMPSPSFDPSTSQNIPHPRANSASSHRPSHKSDSSSRKHSYRES